MKSTKYDFTIALGIVDFIPCIFWGIAMVLLGEWFRSFHFVAGAVFCLVAGLCKVTWKLLIATKQLEIKLFNASFHILMPLGMAMIGLGMLSGNRRGVATKEVIVFILQSPSRYLLWIGLAFIVLMFVWRFSLDMTKLKNNWIAEITNSLAQGFILLGVLALVYAGDYYHYAQSYSDEELTSMYQVNSETHEGYYSFEPTNYEQKDNRCGIVFYPGGKVEAKAYIPLMEAIASKGIVTILVEMPDNLAILKYDAVEDIDYRSQYPEITDWYLAGHSLGAATASMYAAGIKEDVSTLYKGIIFLGSYSSKDLSESGLRTITIYGSEDQVMNREKYEEYMPNLPKTNAEFVIDGGCHGYFGDYGMQSGDGTPAITPKEQWDITADIISDFVFAQ